MKEEIAAIRKDYRLQTLNENDVSDNPFFQFERWWKQAISSEIDEVNAMTLATADAAGTPHARIVLLKDFDENGFVFFTNYDSHKGSELLENNKAAIVFFWKELERQVRIEGIVKKVDEAISDAYFKSRPFGSRMGAWASPQSKTIENRNLLENNVKKYEAAFGENIPRPAHWGGYAVMPTVIEFWQGRSNRLHDRLLYTKSENGVWKISRLAP
jgi:pyridoxamine 5'-phosphate oxidase